LSIFCLAVALLTPEGTEMRKGEDMLTG